MNALIAFGLHRNVKLALKINVSGTDITLQILGYHSIY